MPLLTAALATALLGACSNNSDDASKPDAVQSQLRQTLPPLLANLEDSSRFLTQSESMQAIGESMNSLQDLLGPAFDSTSDTLAIFAANEDDEFQDIEIDGEELAETLIEELFNSENYAGNGDYRIPATLVCDSEEGELLPGGTEPPPVLDQGCIDMVAAVDPRIHVEEAGDGIDFDFIVGENRINPLTLELRKNRLSVVTDLSEAALAAAFLSAESGEDIQLPQTIAGVIAATLQVNGPSDVSLSFAIRSAVEVSGEIEGDEVRIRLGESDPMFSLQIDAPGEKIVASMDVKRTELSFPNTLFLGSEAGSENPEGSPKKQFEMDWQGLSSTFIMSAEQPSGQLSNLGIGEGKSTLKFGGETFFSAEFNADSGSTFDLSFSEVENQLPILTIAPEFDLDLFVDLRPWAQEGDEDVPSSLSGENYSISLTGDSPSIQVIDESDEEGAIRIVSGTLEITSSAGTGDLSIATGQCLVTSEPTDDEHGLLGYFQSADCL